ncbi:MAG: O-antigen ligase family protein, partial [Pseudomonadota bacterium]
MVIETDAKRYIQTGLCMLVFSTPLVFLPQVWHLYTLSKESFIRLLTAALFGAWFVGTRISGRWEIRFSPLGLPILLYVSAMGLSLFNAVNPYAGIAEVLRQLPHLLIFFLVINHVKDKRDSDRICDAAVAAGLAVSLVGIFQYFTGFEPDWLIQAARPAATFGNKNMASQYVIMVIPLSLAHFLQAEDEKQRLFFAVAAVEMTAYVIYGHSRGAWLGLTAGGLACLFYFLKAGRPALHWGLSKKRSSVLAFLLFVHIVLPHVLPMPTKLDVDYGKRMTSTLDPSAGSVRARLAVWANTLDIIRDHPFGVGIGNWKAVYPKYTRSRMIDRVSSSEKHFERAHNDYLQMTAEIGIPGFAVYAWILSYLLWSGWKSADHSFAPFFLWSLVGFMTTSFFSFPLKMPATGLMLWLIGGLVVASRGTMPEARWQPTDPRENRSRSRNPRSGPGFKGRRSVVLSFLSLSVAFLLFMTLFSG